MAGRMSPTDSISGNGPKGTEGGLAPLYQYAAHLSRTRFISSAMLAFFSPMTGAAGDTQAAAGAFVAWTLFVFGASCAASADGLGIRRGWLPAVHRDRRHFPVGLRRDTDPQLRQPDGVVVSALRDERPGCCRTAGHVSGGAARRRTRRDPVHLPGDEPVRRLRPRAGGGVPGDAGPPVDGVGQDLPAGWCARAHSCWFPDAQISRGSSRASCRRGDRARQAAVRQRGIFPYLLDFAKWPTAFWGFQTGPSGTQQTALAFATRYVIAGSLWILSVVRHREPAAPAPVGRRPARPGSLGRRRAAGRAAALRLWGLQAPALRELGDGRRRDRGRGGHRGARRRERGRTRRAPHRRGDGRRDRVRVLRQFRRAPTRLSPAPRSTDGRAVSGAHRGQRD